MSSLPPFLWITLGGFALPFLPRRLRQLATLALPLVTMWHLTQLTVGTTATCTFWGYELTVLDVDKLSLVFGWIFTITVFCWSIYAWHLKRAKEPAAAFVYGGAALGVVFAGDMLTLFLNWEVMALSSTLVILAADTPRARQAAYRYAIVHLVGGVLLLFGIGVHHHETGSLAFGHLGDIDSLATWLIFLGFAVNAAVPPLSAWLPDSYPEGSPSGSVFLSAFTTKTSVYVMATAFAGAPILVVLGAFMSVYGIFYALNENDARRVLSYSIMNQVGFMICGIGIGTELAINGVAAHAFCHILYKSLLFMSAGAVLYRTGRSKCTELGGLWRTMPWTLVFGTIGALSISAMPFTNGFVSKPMIVDAAAAGAEGHVLGHGADLMMFAYLILMVASAGVSLHAGIKFPWFVFFAKDRGLRPKEAPFHMLLAMGIVAALCIGLGIYAQPLYDLLPYETGFQAYTTAHVLLQFEILVASGFAFFLLLPVLKRTDTITLDTDWVYRRLGNRVIGWIEGPLMAAFGWMSRFAHERVPGALIHFSKNPAGAMKLGLDRVVLAWAGLFGDDAQLERARGRLKVDQDRYQATRASSAWPIGTTVLYMSLVFLLYLVIYLWR